MISTIRRIGWNDQHDLHQYINFNDGPPTYLDECVHPLELPTPEDYRRRRNRNVSWLGNNFLRQACERLGQEFIIYGVIGRGSRYV